MRPKNPKALRGNDSDISDSTIVRLIDVSRRGERRSYLAGMLLGYRMAAVVKGGNDGSERQVDASGDGNWFGYGEGGSQSASGS
jgi:hypothetical protein